MNVAELLDTYLTEYKISEHRPVFTAQRMAQEEHVHGMNVAKSVVVKGDDISYLCVLPACCKIDFEALKTVLGVHQIKLVDEDLMQQLFPDCEVGAEPPFGSFYGLPTIMDDRLTDDEYIVFQSGTHRQAITMAMTDYIKIEGPKIFSFSYHV